MTVLVLDSNLLWSARLTRALAALGHQAAASPRLPADLTGIQTAILNLNTPEPRLSEEAAALQAAGIFLIAHAGHKERDLLQKGRSLGIDLVVTHSTIAHHLGRVMDQAAKLDRTHIPDPDEEPPTG